MSRLGRRLGKLENTARSQRADRGPALLIVSPDEWPEDDRAAYDAAGVAGDRAVRSTLIERHVRVRPGPATRMLEFRLRRDGPQ